MRVHVELPEELDVVEHGERNARGEIPDRTPYGLHQIADADPDDPVEVTFRRPAHGAIAYGARKVRNRLDGYEPVTAITGRRQRRGADVLFCMDERTGIPGALSPARPPVITGSAWLETPERLAPAHRRAATAALRRSAAVFSQSPAMVSLLREHWGLDPERVHRVTLGIDPEFFPSQPWSERDGADRSPSCPPMVTSVGDDRGRDHPTLVEAIRLVDAGGQPVRLELATTLPVSVPEKLGVVHARRMNAAMRGLYARSSVVAVALRSNPQGSGLTVALEALASGRPVVATDNPGMDSYIEHGRTGILVPEGDAQAMADAVAELFADPERARRMGEEGRRDVEARFTTAHMAAELRAIARAVAGR
jgi:glycosyltransferase involved in cell wall biosynthesis